MPYHVKLLALTFAIWIGLVLSAFNIAAKIELLRRLSEG